MVITLMIWGLVFNEITESNIIELDAGSYIISGLISLITIYVSRLQNKPSSKSYPLGYTGFVPILNLIRSFMIILICLKSIAESIGDIISGPKQTEHAIVFLYAGVTLVINCFSFFIINQSAKKTKSEILKMDAVEWRIDIFSNLAIIISFLISYVLLKHHYSTLSNHIDPVFCILLSVIMCISPIKLFTKNMKKLAVSSVDEKTQKEIISGFNAQLPNVTEFSPYFTIIDMAGILWVEIRINPVHKNELSVSTLKEWELKGKEILDNINSNHHLTFRLN
ncbi:MAG: cation transporter [Bacteroidetes bacterium]|nr:cation transporter [Bacteroidota bacterium]